MHLQSIWHYGLILAQIAFVCYRIQTVWWLSRYSGSELLTASLQTHFLSLKSSSKINLLDIVVDIIH